MLTIRKEQVAVLQENMKKSFEENAVKQLKEKYPEHYKGKNEEEMLGFIREGTEKAAGFKIVEREDVFSFLEYLTCYGKEFYLDPANDWARRVFRIRNLQGDERMIRLKKYKPLKTGTD